MSHTTNTEEVVIETIEVSDESEVEMTELKPTEERRISRRKKTKLVS